MRPRFRGLILFILLLGALAAGVRYVVSKRASIVALFEVTTSGSPTLTAAELASHEIDMLAFGCGVERWAVKTLSDEGAAQTIETEAHEMTIRELLALPPPRWSRNAPRFPSEVQVIVDAEIWAYKLEPDGDIHLIIGADHANMVVEFPSPSCVPRVAARPAFQAAREQLLTILNTLPDSTTRQPSEPIPVRIRGVLFWDKSHGQIGGTWNGAELHPVLEITRR